MTGRAVLFPVIVYGVWLLTTVVTAVLIRLLADDPRDRE
jgi:ABC-type thiamin/hydroxymethylpyrimidine transport system permease subunit